MAAAPSLGHDGGLTILDPGRTALLNALDDLFAGWGREAGGEEVFPPPLFPVTELEKFDVYVNFLHLSLVAASLRADGDMEPREGRFEAGQLQPAHLGLPHSRLLRGIPVLRGAPSRSGHGRHIGELLLPG